MAKMPPNPVDVQVGSRIRLRRNIVDMSQEKLGEACGISFQQIQKYELGKNRVSASRLQQIAKALGAPIAFFFQEMPSELDAPSAEAMKCDDSGVVVRFLSTREGLELNRAFASIRNQKVRRKIVELTKIIAGESL